MGLWGRWIIGQPSTRLLHPEQVLFRCFDLPFVSTSSGMSTGAAVHGRLSDGLRIPTVGNAKEATTPASTQTETVERFVRGDMYSR